jgi:Na+-transporting NADH:ubiquinone oxidoreductase subunit C
MPDNQSTGKVFLVSFVLCAVCSVLVSVSAVMLKPLQTANRELDFKKNLLIAAGLLEGCAERQIILSEFEKIEQIPIETSGGPRTVYVARSGGAITHYIFPVEGKGLWSTMYGFMALSADFRSVKGMGFYEHGETPGLGGEITNPKWLASFRGKRAYDEGLTPVLEVIKGAVDPESDAAAYRVDGLSGATLTTRGVDSMIKFWLSEEGYLPFVRSRMEKGAHQ